MNGSTQTKNLTHDELLNTGNVVGMSEELMEEGVKRKLELKIAVKKTSEILARKMTYKLFECVCQRCGINNSDDYIKNKQMTPVVTWLLCAAGVEGDIINCNRESELLKKIYNNMIMDTDNISLNEFDFLNERFERVVYPFVEAFQNSSTDEIRVFCRQYGSSYLYGEVIIKKDEFMSDAVFGYCRVSSSIKTDKYEVPLDWLKVHA